MQCQGRRAKKNSAIFVLEANKSFCSSKIEEVEKCERNALGVRKRLTGAVVRVPGSHAETREAEEDADR